MSFEHLQTLFARRIPLVYVSPPICEADFSSTAEPIVILNPFPTRRYPSGVRWVRIGDHWRLEWDAEPGVICWSIYRKGGDPNNPWILVAECVTTNYYDFEDGDEPDGGVTAIYPEGETVIYDAGQAQEGGGGGCATEEGDPVPEGEEPFEITEDVDWGVFSFSSEQAWPSDPTTYRYVELGEFPTGSYVLEYEAGYSYTSINSGNNCDGVPDPAYMGTAWKVSLWDDQNGYAQLPNVLVSEASPQLVCSASLGALALEMEAAFKGLRYWPQYYPANPEHEEGPLYLVRDVGQLIELNYGETYAVETLAKTEPYSFRLVQISGRADMPKTLIVQNWDAIREQFPSAIGDTWNGELSRTEYTSASCVWTAAASGGFGGATCVYSQAVAESPNSCGWVLSVYAAGAVLYWQGIKIVNGTGVGLYQTVVEVSLSPGCMYLEEVPEE